MYLTSSFFLNSNDVDDDDESTILFYRRGKEFYMHAKVSEWIWRGGDNQNLQPQLLGLCSWEKATLDYIYYIIYYIPFHPIWKNFWFHICIQKREKQEEEKKIGEREVNERKKQRKWDEIKIR